jgi:hypothetical protein
MNHTCPVRRYVDGIGAERGGLRVNAQGVISGEEREAVGQAFWSHRRNRTGNLNLLIPSSKRRKYEVKVADLAGGSYLARRSDTH